jgi:putative phosphoserine phosphatase / 1-acylglycerol-3-phosphate O-acyltransferase
MSMRAAFFDIDGTLTSERTWKGIMDYFTRNHLRRGMHLAFLGAHYPLYYLRRFDLISESAFRAPWAAHLAWYVRGYTPRQAEPVWDWAVERFLSQYWRQDTLRLLDEHLRAGDMVILVSAAPQPLVQHIACELGASYAIGTRFKLRGGRYTGGVVPPVVIDEGKAQAAQAVIQAQRLSVDLSASYSYADSISDRSFLEMVGHPVAVYPDDALRPLASERGWRIFPE